MRKHDDNRERGETLKHPEICGSGKTSGLVIPALLELAGPAVTTSLRSDVVLNTRARRERMGEVHVWDPFGNGTDSWVPPTG